MPTYDTEPAAPARSDRLGPGAELPELGALHRATTARGPSDTRRVGHAGGLPRPADHGPAARSERGDLGGHQRRPRALPRRARSPSSTTTTRLRPTPCSASPRPSASATPDVVYTDQDKLTADGRRTDPFLKPDWSPVYALGAMYVGHLLVVEARADRGRRRASTRRSTRSRTSSCCCGSPSAPTASTTCPRCSTTGARSPAALPSARTRRSGVTELQSRAVNAHLERRGIAAEAVPHPAIPHRLRLKPRPRDGRSARQRRHPITWRCGGRRGRHPRSNRIRRSEVDRGGTGRAIQPCAPGQPGCRPGDGRVPRLPGRGR